MPIIESVGNLLTPLGGSAPFFALPTAYKSFIAGRTSGTTRYVSWTYGNNSNAGTSKSAPKKTIPSAVTASASNDTIILAPEIHYVTGNPYTNEAHQVVSATTSSAVKTNVWIIGYPTKTVVCQYAPSASTRDSMFFGGGANSGIMGCILERDLTGGSEGFTTNYMTAIWNGNDNSQGGGASTRPIIYNCVLKNASSDTAVVYRPGGASGNSLWSWGYDNSSDSYGSIQNSLIYMGTSYTWNGSYTGASGMITVGSTVFTGASYNSGDSQVSLTNVEGSFSLNTTGYYRTGTGYVTDTNSRGLYSGTYSWAPTLGYPGVVFNGVNW